MPLGIKVILISSEPQPWSAINASWNKSYPH